LLGDPAYLGRAGARAVPPPARAFRRQALHAARLTVTHPVSGACLSWERAPPADFAALLEALQQYAPAG
jgi:23S rRNA pseudouridine1911/1915/1917 synthase